MSTSSHLHPCPDCEKAIPHTGSDCEKFLLDFFKKYPCRKAREKRLEVTSGTCLHCGETDLPEDQMEPLSDGGPSNMCLSCGVKQRASEDDYKRLITSGLWHEQAAASAQIAAERDAWGKMSKSERKRAMAGKASGDLFQRRL